MSLLLNLMPVDVTKYQFLTSVSVFVGLVYLLTKINKTFHSLLVFSWACFITPLFHKAKKSNKLITSKNSNQSALELFYSNQAHVYDDSRKFLLKGRLECLKIAANHLSKHSDLVWVDIGGGTGYNIELMDKILPISRKFKSVYLVDLSPSLCVVARERFAKKGWTNVHVIESDACDFKIHEHSADLITFSYSLSMIPTFNSAIDHSVNLLDKQGVIAAVDFGIQNSDTSMGRINTLGGLVGRNYPWILRNFWRIWFEADKVFLDSSRRNYLEYKYGTLKSLNCYNNSLGKIPYYIWIGCDKSKSSQILNRVNCLATESPYLAPAETVVGPFSKGHEAALVNLQKNLPFPSIYYQKQICRVYYDEENPLFEQFGNQYIYAFTWEDPREDHRILNFNQNDTVLAITSAGDNILHYASLPNPPRRIHAVDLNPAQNHLLELKLACFRGLSHEQVWSIFGEGKIANFKDLLVSKLSSHMSSQAFQFWFDKGELTFDPKGKGLYNTGFSRWALRLGRWVFALFGIQKDVVSFCNSTTMEQQEKIWNDTIKKSLFNPVVSTLLVGNPIFLWKALGVPANQAKMMGNSVFKYVVDTLNPVVSRSLISRDNYFYYLAMMGRYAYNNCPEYLTVKSFGRLSGKNSPIDNIRIHTDTLNDVFDRLKEKSLTIAIIMDHMDWFDPKGKDAINEINALKNCLAPGGRVMLRSASQHPWYISTFEELGFTCEAAGVRFPGESIDRINMYASTWVCIKSKDQSRRRMSSLKI